MRREKCEVTVQIAATALANQRYNSFAVSALRHHETEVQWLTGSGPHTAAQSTLRVECRFITAFQTRFRGVLNARS
jgi:hypothetical protein